jgi:hypothetical protein
MLAADPSLRRLELYGRLLRFPVFASLGVFAIGIVLAIVLDASWLWLVVGGILAWLLFARLAIGIWRRIHLTDHQWRLDHSDQRERNLLTLAQRATWNWSDEVPPGSSHAVLVLSEIGGELRVESFCHEGAARARIDERVDLLGGEQEPIVVGLVELDTEPERALIDVEAGRIGDRRALESLPLAQDGWLVGI